jgi:DNA-directed RNA polymerase II subunit RPB1
VPPQPHVLEGLVAIFSHSYNTETMDEQRLRPREKGPNDPHLGTIDRNFKCNTCEENMTECPGHFGVIKLATPVYHYGFMTKVKKILETVCHNCGKIKATDVSLRIECGV